MACPECGANTLSFPLPADLAAHLPHDAPGGDLCTRCLSVAPNHDPPADYPDFAAASDAFPPDPEHALTLVCLLALLDSIALYRPEVDAVTDRAEAEGTDVLLALDRLQRDEAIDPHFDLAKRSHQLQQLLG